MDFAAKMLMFVEDDMESSPTKKERELHLHSLEKWRTPNQKNCYADAQK